MEPESEPETNTSSMMTLAGVLFIILCLGLGLFAYSHSTNKTSQTINDINIVNGDVAAQAKAMQQLTDKLGTLETAVNTISKKEINTEEIANKVSEKIPKYSAMADCTGVELNGINATNFTLYCQKK